MDIEHHTPSLTHLREFAKARSKGRRTHVAQDRRQVLAPADDRIFAFAYEKFLTSVIEFVRNGSRGGAMARAVAAASDRMRPSYAAAERGMSQVIAAVAPSSVQRRQRNVVVLDEYGDGIVSLRIHLVFDRPGDARLWTFMYFSADALTEVEMMLMETAIALAVRQLDPSGVPAILLVRLGVVHSIDPKVALTASRIAVLRAESAAYRAAWAVAA